MCISNFRFLDPDHIPHLAEDCLSQADKKKIVKDSENNSAPHIDTNGEKPEENSGGPSDKPTYKRLSKAEKKRLRGLFVNTLHCAIYVHVLTVTFSKLPGQNKARPAPFKVDREQILCHTLIDLVEGETPEPCNRSKCFSMHDIKAFMAKRPPDIGTTCYNYEVRGRCPRGINCRCVCLIQVSS